MNMEINFSKFYDQIHVRALARKRAESKKVSKSTDQNKYQFVILNIAIKYDFL